MKKRMDYLIPEEQMNWLRDKALDVHDRSIMPLEDGTPVYSPMGYRGCWPRDMYYIITGVPERVSHRTIAKTVELFLARQHASGMVPKDIAVDGSPRYVCWHVPGGYDVDEPLAMDDANPSWNKYKLKPEADSGQFVAMLAHEYWLCTDDLAFVERNLKGLVRAMDAMPRDESGLIWIDPKHPHTTYGFTDNVVKTGNELFCSLLYWEASRMLADLARAVGNHGVMSDFLQRARLIEQNIDRLKDPDSGVYFAATGIGRQIDIWGNAYLVYAGFLDEERRLRICRYLADNVERFSLKGQIRHLNRGEYWEKMYVGSVGDMYGLGVFQNGAYWGAATGWVGYAIAQVDLTKAARLFNDLIDAGQVHGLQEYVFEDGRPGPIEDYSASIINPLAALRRLASEGIHLVEK